MNTPGGLSETNIPINRESMKKVMNLVDEVKVDNRQQRFSKVTSHSMIMKDIYTDDKAKKR